MNSYERFCFNLLGKRMKAKRDDYAVSRNDLISARFRTPFEVYLSTAYVSAIIVGLLGAVVIGAISWFLQLPNLVKYKGEVPEIVLGLSPVLSHNRDHLYYNLLPSGVWGTYLSCIYPVPRS